MDRRHETRLLRDRPSSERGATAPKAAKRKIALVCGDVSRDESLTCVSLPHPRGLEKVLFVRRGTKLLELQRKSAEFGSWFVDDAVHSDSGVVLATPYDARLTVLSLLTGKPDVREKWQPLEQVVSDGAAVYGAELRCLLELDLGDLGALCDTNDRPGLEDLNLVKLNDERCVAWLQAKVGRVAAQPAPIPQQNVNVLHHPCIESLSLTPLNHVDNSF